MSLVSNARAILLTRDLPCQVGSHDLEIADCPFQRGDLACFFGNLEPHRPQRGITWLHRAYPNNPMFNRMPAADSQLQITPQLTPSFPSTWVSLAAFLVISDRSRAV